jgi:hypothetical protein
MYLEGPIYLEVALVEIGLWICGGIRVLASLAKLLLAWFAVLYAVVVGVSGDPRVARRRPYRAGLSAKYRGALSGAYNHRFFRVDESFRASTRAGLTRARSLSTWVYSERNAVTHLPGLPPSYRVSRAGKCRFKKIKKKKEKIESRKTYVRKNTTFSVLRSQNALKTPRLRPLKC